MPVAEKGAHGRWLKKVAQSARKAFSPKRGPAEGEKRYSLAVVSGSFDEVRVALSGRLDMNNAGMLYDDFRRLIISEPLRNVVVDVRGVEYIDAAGVAALSEAKELCARRKNALKIVKAEGRLKDAFARVHGPVPSREGIFAPRPVPNLLEQLGEGTLKVLNTTKDILTFIGEVSATVAHTLFPFRGRRTEDLWKLVEKAGCDAVPIVTALGVLMGAVMAFQSAIQLRKFGANIFVADLVSLSVCLEMGPLMTALIVAGRSGAAYAAEIGTMQVTEEIDALRVMGVDPVRRLVSPRIMALAFALPCLTLFADLLGIIGGGFVAFVSLDLTPTTYVSQIRKVLELSDVAKGLVKSCAFGVEVALIGCLRGFQVRGGAESVGAAATSSVVTSIFIIVLTDAVFSVTYHYLGFF
jgi:phospholipid/cholesterol/gamma-HCH transport system permease protein